MSFPPYFGVELVLLTALIPGLAICAVLRPDSETWSQTWEPGLLQAVLLIGAMILLWRLTYGARWRLRVPCLLAGYILFNIGSAMIAAICFLPARAGFWELPPYLLAIAVPMGILLAVLLAAARR